MSFELDSFLGRPYDQPGCASSTDPSVSCARAPTRRPSSSERSGDRARPLYRHGRPPRLLRGRGLGRRRRSCVRRGCRRGPSSCRQFAVQLRPTDRVAMEATGNALAIARIIGPHVAAVEIVNTRRLKAIAESKQKTDRHDAKTLAQLLAAGMFEGSWQPDEATRMLRRRVARRARLVVAPDALEERDPGGAPSQPEAAAADERPFRRRRPRVARPAGAARRRAGHDQRRAAADRLPQRGDRDDRDRARALRAPPRPRPSS